MFSGVGEYGERAAVVISALAVALVVLAGAVKGAPKKDFCASKAVPSSWDRSAIGAENGPPPKRR